MALAGLVSASIIVSVPPTGAAEDETPTTLPTVTPFVPPAGPPLQLSQEVSTSQASPGDRLTIRLRVEVNSPQPAAIRVSDTIDGQLDLLGADSTGGGCSLGPTVVCTVQAQAGQPALVTLQVQVRQGAQGTLSNQASASVNGLTAASERAVIGLVAAQLSPAPDQAPPPPAEPPERPPVAPPAQDASGSSMVQPPSATPRPDQRDDEGAAEGPDPIPEVAPTAAPAVEPTVTPALRQRAPSQSGPALPVPPPAQAAPASPPVESAPQGEVVPF